MNYTLIVSSLIVIAVVLAVGYLIVKMPFMRKYYVPASMISGLILLVLSPQIIGTYMPEWQIINPDFYAFWATLPGMLINVVFACLFLSHPAISLRSMWRKAAPQAAFGQMIAWGQYALGGIVTLLLLVPLFNANPLSAALIEISFEGGHGTASGLQPVFERLGFGVGHEMAVGLATLSLITALISGIIVINWGRKRRFIRRPRHRSVSQMVYHRRIVHELHKQGLTLRQHFTPLRLIVNLLLVAVAVAIGWGIYQGLLLLEEYTWGTAGVTIIGYLPMFTICMFGGLIAQKLWHLLRIPISRSIVDMISSTALSVLIVTAIGAMSLQFFSTHLPIFLILAAVGIVWILFAFFVFAPRMFRKNWFQNGVVNMGQSMGQTATGILFVKMADPNDKTDAMESFGYKQLLFEPFVGGGIITALSMPAILYLGLPIFTLITTVVCVVWIVLGLLVFRKY